jgi:hypothetical protein
MMRVRKSHLFVCAATVLLSEGSHAFGCAAAARAESLPASGYPRDRYQLSAHAETYAELFRRALLPGANGSLVSTDTVVPLYEYLSLRASDIDTGWRRDSLDLEFAGWARSWFGARDAESRLDGDVQVASARYRHGPVSLRFGRQVIGGGAARFARFDGLAIEAEHGAGLELKAYGGWSVLPRWNQGARYEHLGAASDSLLRDEDTLESVPRARYWLAGARLGFSSAERRAGISFHEQREPGGLSHRNLGFDGRAPLSPRARLGANAVLELDRQRFADARLWLDTNPTRAIDLSLEYLHNEPALFLSRQSVLSVFGSASYDEVGSYASFRVTDALRLDGAGFVQVYDGERPGGRSELSARWFADPSRSTFLRLTYARVLAPDNGYHSLRSSLARRFAAHFRGTLEAYAYLYDEAIRGYRTSSVYAGTLSLDPAPELSVLWGASLAHTPYASLDAQTELRVSYWFDLSKPKVAR